MGYIDKSDLVAEIKRLLAFYLKEIEDNKEDPWVMDIAKRDILQEILSFIDTLEVKEVDLNLDNELDEYIKNNNAFIKDDFVVEKNNGDSFNHIYDLEGVAKHFFEFGIAVSNKAQKGE